MRGFTLIETVIYIALLSVLLVSAAEALISIEGTVGYEDTDALTTEEGAFATSKIEYAIEHHTASEITLDKQTHQLGVTQGSHTYPLTSLNITVERYSLTPILDAEGNEVGERAVFTMNGEEFGAEGQYSP